MEKKDKYLVQTKTVLNDGEGFALPTDKEKLEYIKMFMALDLMGVALGYSITGMQTMSDEEMAELKKKLDEVNGKIEDSGYQYMDGLNFGFTPQEKLKIAEQGGPVSFTSFDEITNNLMIIKSNETQDYFDLAETALAEIVAGLATANEGFSRRLQKALERKHNEYNEKMMAPMQGTDEDNGPIYN